MDYTPEQIEYINMQNAQQQQQIPYFPPVSPINENTLVSQTNPKDILEELQHKLRSEIPESGPDGKINWKRPSEVRPMMNERGIHSVLVDCYGIINQNTILSNLDEEDVRVMVLEHSKALTLKLAVNWKEFECEKSNLSTIVLIVASMIYTSLRRGFNQDERTFLKTAVRSTEQIMVRPTNMNSMQGEQKKWWQIWK